MNESTFGLGQASEGAVVAYMDGGWMDGHTHTHSLSLSLSDQATGKDQLSFDFGGSRRRMFRY